MYQQDVVDVPEIYVEFFGMIDLKGPLSSFSRKRHASTPLSGDPIGSPLIWVYAVSSKVK